MYLKKLTLSGFKSFADPTEFCFHRGTTAVVGPNGCGKSNIVDAFRWVLGERRAKELRGSEMLDVIFKGAGSREPMSRAEVLLLFDNSDSALAIDHSEVEVGRRLYRSGESEYLINGKKCRLKDVHALFADTGIGAHGYSVLEQGNVDGFLHSNPAERRAIFEEAAGVSRYKKQKVQSARQLDRVEANLLRLQDIFSEVERRIRSVKIQAGKARRFIEDRELVRKLRTVLAGRDIAAFREEREELTFELSLSETRRALLESVVERQEKDRHEAQENLDAAREECTELRNREMELRVTAERTEQRRAHMSERCQEIRTGQERRQQQRAELVTVEQDYQGRRQETRTGLREEIQVLRGVRQELETADTRRRELSQEKSECEGRVQEAKERALSSLYDETKASNERTSLESDLRGLQALEDRRRREQEEFARELESLEKARAGFTEELGETRELKQQDETKAHALRTEIQERVELLSDANQRLTALQEQVTRDQARLRFLEGLEESREGIGRGARSLLDGSHVITRDIAGLLADAIEADPRTAPMVDAVLGHLSEMVVFLGGTPLADRTRALSGLLDGDGVTFCELRSDPERVGARNDGPALLLDQISFDSHYEGLLEQLFAGVYVAESVEEALASNESGPKRRFVTPDGSLVEPWGGITLPSQNDTRLVSRRTEIHALRQELSRLREQLARAEEHGASLEQAIEVRQVEAQQREEGARRRQLEVESLERKCEEANQNMDRCRSRLATIEKEISDLDENRQGIGVRLEEVGRQIEQTLQVRQEAEQIVAEGEQILEGISSELEVHEEQVAGLRLSATQKEERMISLRREEVRLRGEIEERLSRRLLLDQEDAADQKRLEDYAQEDLECAAELESLQENLAQVHEQVAEASAVVEANQQHLRRFEDLAQQVREEVERLRSGREQLLIRENEIGVRIAGIREKLREEFELELADAPHEEWLAELRGDVEDEEDAVLLERLRGELEKAVERLRKNANVNLEAVEELQELEERHGFLEGQIADLITSKERLLETIENLNERSRELFLETFETVRGHFVDLFQTIFGGGTAELRLEEGADPLEAGIEVIARPPGKRISSLKLLSGGEKALTAISVLFALFRTKPSPFCILDEVDAPLDEANIRRFVRALKEFIGNTQFLIVTHSKITMSKAERLYGVTMQERGVSRQIAVEIEKVEELGLVEPGTADTEPVAEHPLGRLAGDPRIPEPGRGNAEVPRGGTLIVEDELLSPSGSPETPLSDE